MEISMCAEGSKVYFLFRFFDEQKLRMVNYTISYGYEPTPEGKPISIVKSEFHGNFLNSSSCSEERLYELFEDLFESSRNLPKERKK